MKSVWGRISELFHTYIYKWCHLFLANLCWFSPSALYIRPIQTTCIYSLLCHRGDGPLCLQLGNRGQSSGLSDGHTCSRLMSSWNASNSRVTTHTCRYHTYDGNMSQCKICLYAQDATGLGPKSTLRACMHIQYHIARFWIRGTDAKCRRHFGFLSLYLNVRWTVLSEGSVIDPTKFH